MKFKVGDRITRKDPPSRGSPTEYAIVMSLPQGGGMGLQFEDPKAHQSYNLSQDGYAYFHLPERWMVAEPKSPFYEDTTDYYRAITCDE